MSILPGISFETKHLYEVDSQERESESIYLHFCINGIPFNIENFNFTRNYLIGVNIPFQCILKKNKLVEHNINDGDIDICLIPLIESFSNDAQIFAPNFDTIIAIEVKQMAFDLDDNIISPKPNQQYYREQASKLCQLGFNEVILLYIVSTQPIKGSTGSFRDCLAANGRAESALEKIKPFIVVNSEDLFSTKIFVFGSVESSPGPYSGSPVLGEYPFVPSNTLKDRSNPFRQTFENKVAKLFPHSIHPARFPIQMRGCKSCRRLYLFPQAEKENCPDCKRPFV